MRSPMQPGRPAGIGASDAATEELGRYFEARFEAFEVGSEGEPATAIPLPDEPFALWWADRTREIRTLGAHRFLETYLPRLWFPVRAGMSREPAYRAANLRGARREELPEATGLPVECPEAVNLEVYASFAGRLPVITVRHRPDFVRLVQALAKRNEPVPVPASQGAAMVGGMVNWERIRELRRQWENRTPANRERATWADEWAFLIKRRELYQDRLIILSDGPYSGVPASDLELPDRRWKELSLLIRREHECAHYFTRRAFGSMRNHLWDELIADYVGMVAAVGAFRADWFLRFLGIEGVSASEASPRIELYRGDPPLSDAAFGLLREVARGAAETLEAFDRYRWPEIEESLSLARRARMIRALASVRPDELASSRGQVLLKRALARVERLAD